jgi:hypothetical protein
MVRADEKLTAFMEVFRKLRSAFAVEQGKE